MGEGEEREERRPRRRGNRRVVGASASGEGRPGVGKRWVPVFFSFPTVRADFCPDFDMKVFTDWIGDGWPSYQPWSGDA